MWPLKIAEVQLEEYFAGEKKSHTKYYIASWDNYLEYLSGKVDTTDYKKYRQWEKDERVWTAITMIDLFEDVNFKERLKEILINCYGIVPPVKKLGGHQGTITWEDCLEGEFKLYLEANLPAPVEYKTHLSHNLDKTNFIPYIKDWGSKNKDGKYPYRPDLEGATDVDALIINTSNGFSIFIEAKALSDISYQVTYDMKRNQIARNLEVMMQDFRSRDSRMSKLHEDIQKIDSEASLFMLLTPQVFKNDWRSRLYGYKYWDYKNNPLNIKNDLPHLRKTNIDWNNLSDRIGWITWEDIWRMNTKEFLDEIIKVELVKDDVLEEEHIIL